MTSGATQSPDKWKALAEDVRASSHLISANSFLELIECVYLIMGLFQAYLEKM